MPSDPKTGTAAPLETAPAPGAAAPSITGSAVTEGPPTGPAPAPDPGGGAGGGGSNGGPAPGPSGGPGGGATGESTGGPGSGLGGGATGGPGAPGDGTATSTGDAADAFAGNAADSFLSLIASATSTDALEAQRIILRRIALQGDVVPSRVPPPKNITEIGGYLNLLATLNEIDMRAQVLAGILGVAGPNPPLGWLSSAPPITFVAIANDRPVGAAQATIPVTVPIRSDFAPALQAALENLRDQGCQIPLMPAPTTLPSADGNATAPADALPYLGRVLFLSAAVGLVDPATDALALVRTQGTTHPFEVAAAARGPAAAAVPAANYDVLRCDATSCTTLAMPGAQFVPLAPAIATAGFYPPSSPPQPTSAADTGWTRLTNVSGLVAGQTKLGDELALLYASDTIATSVFAGMLGSLWNGTSFVASA